MPLITRTERTDENAGLGISNPIIVYNASPQHQSWSPVTMLVYLNWHGGAACLIERTQTSSTNGLRFNISSTSGNHWFGARSGSGNFPVKYADSPNTIGQWRHLAAVWGGSHLASSITLYHADAGGSITPSGSSSATDGSSSSLYPFAESTTRGLRLYNLGTTDAPDWPTRADVAYIAVWKRALTQAELEQARSEGPLNVHPSDLVLLRANGTDLSGYGATTLTEPAFPDGDLPPILTLGGAVPLVTAPISRSLVPESVELPEPGLTVAAISRAVTPASVALPSIQIHDDFERCSIDLALSSVSIDIDDVPLVSLQARRQTSTIGTMRWLEPVAKLTGVLGLRPRIEINPFQSTAGDYRNHQTWWTQQRAHYSYDGENWTPISAKATTSTRLTWRHDAPFEQDTVYVARSWPRSLTQIGTQVAAAAAAHPTKIAPAPSAAAYTPANPHGFPAAAYICDELPAKTDELGRAVPVTPIYGFLIDDQASPTKRKTAVITMGIHAGEDVGEVVAWEQIDYLLGNSASAQALRATTRILIYPCVNPAGRFAGYWRGAPGSNVDTNAEWNVTTPTNDCVTKAKAAILSDVASLGNPVAWGFDIHATPGTGGRLQLGINIYRPDTVEFDSLVRAKYPAGLWGDYSDRTVVPGDLATSHTITGFQRRDLAAKLVMLNETADAVGPISPAIMRPYAEAQVDALADMDAAGWFDDAPAGTLTLGTPSVTSSSISLPWAYSAADHDGIEYRYRLTAGAWSAWIDAWLVSPIEITGLASGAEYEIEAQAYNVAGAGAPQTVTITVGAVTTVSPSAGSIAATGHAPAVLQGDAQAIAPQAGHVHAHGYAPTLSQPITIAPSKGSITATGYATTVEQTPSVRPQAGRIAAHGYAPTIGQAQIIAPTRAQAVAAGHTPIVVKGVRVDPQTGHVEFAGHAPAIAQGGARTVAPAVGRVRAMGWAPGVTTMPIGGYPSSVTITVPSGRTITLRPR